MKTFHDTFFKLMDRRFGGVFERAVALMTIAKPILLVMTPIGVTWGLVEAWRFHWWLALLMAVLVGIISLFAWMTVRRIRTERGPTGRTNC
jgi:hypothetical protein